jgi:hypothetical protein
VERRFATAEALRQALERYLVDERIMVARSSVAQLLRRVLGGRIERRREDIRNALAQLDGELRPGLVPMQPVARNEAWSEVELGSDSVSSSSLSLGYAEQAGFSGTPSTPLNSRPTSSGTPHPQTLEQPRRTRSSAVFFLGAIAGLMIAIGAGIMLRRTPAAGAGPALTPQSAAPAAHASGGEGISVNNLPELGESVTSLPVAGGEVHRSTAPAPPKPEPKRDSPPPPEAAKQERVELSDDKPAEPVKLTDEAAQQQPKPPPVQAPPEPLLPPNQRPPLNRGAAIAALTAAAGAVAGCARPDGPTGRGRAMVTFSPDGPVSSVTLSPGEFNGNAVGSCVSGRFQRVRIPAFSGSPVTLGQSFVIPD